MIQSGLLIDIITDIHVPKVIQFFKCIKKPGKCKDKKLGKVLKSGKSVLFNGVKKGMGLIRMIGTRNRYKKRRKKLMKAMKSIRKIKKNLNHLSRQIRKAILFSANDS